MTQATTTEGVTSPPYETEQPLGNEPAGGHSHEDLEKAGPAILALRMGLPDTKLEMVLGGPHPLLVDIVRSLARRAAQDHHAGTATATSMPPKRAGTPKQDT